MGEITRGERLQLMLTQAELSALDDWRFTRRMPSRAAALRELLKRGLAADGFDVLGPGRKSKDVGVIDAPTISSRGKRSTRGNGTLERG